MYHSVSDSDETAVQPYYRLATSPDRFREQMQLLAECDCAVTGLEQGIDTAHHGNGQRRQVIVTFDDGYLDFLTHAWPILEEFSFTASVFLPTAFIGETTRRRFKGRECLTWPEVRDLNRGGVSFGSHTVSHAVLYGMPWSQVRAELRESREQIERVLDAPATTFAYPYAFPQNDRDFVARFCLELHEAGYLTTVTTMIGRHAPGDDPLRVRRLPVNDTDDRRLFSAKLAGAYDWVGALQAAWKRAR